MCKRLHGHVPPWDHSPDGVEIMLRDSLRLEKFTDSENLRKKKQHVNMCVYSQVLAGSISSMYTKIRHSLETIKYDVVFMFTQLTITANNPEHRNQT